MTEQPGKPTDVRGGRKRDTANREAASSIGAMIRTIGSTRDTWLIPRRIPPAGRGEKEKASNQCRKADGISTGSCRPHCKPGESSSLRCCSLSLSSALFSGCAAGRKPQNHFVSILIAILPIPSGAIRDTKKAGAQARIAGRCCPSASRWPDPNCPAAAFRGSTRPAESGSRAGTPPDAPSGCTSGP
jgi:hypothetical protein